MAQTRSSTGRRKATVRGDDATVRALADGDAAVFAELVEAWAPVMLRMALVHVERRALAEEVVQEAWLTVLRDLKRFQRRSSLRTWVLGIVVNLARARARTERRAAPFPPDAGPVIDPARFRTAGSGERWPDHWAVGPVGWPSPEDEVLTGEARDVVLRAIAALPRAQREVLALRDLEGCPAAEACAVLGLSEANQRVLLHRARSRVRLAVEDYFGATRPT